MLPIHEMFEGNVTKDSNVVVCFMNAEDGTAEGDLSVYLKDSTQWQLNLGDHLPRFELQEAYNDLKPCCQFIIWWVVVAGDWYHYLFSSGVMIQVAEATGCSRTARTLLAHLGLNVAGHLLLTGRTRERMALMSSGHYSTFYPQFSRMSCRVDTTCSVAGMHIDAGKKVELNAVFERNSSWTF